MNIFQLATSAAPSNMPTGDLSQAPSATHNDDFELLLGDILKQYSTGETVVTDMNCKVGVAGIFKVPESLDTKSMALPGFGKSLLDIFGADIVSLASMLLEGSELPVEQESLLDMLNAVLQQIGYISSLSSDSQSELISQLQSSTTKESLLDKLQKALSELPEPLKIKLQGYEKDGLIDQISPDETTIIQATIMSVLADDLAFEPFVELQNDDRPVYGRETLHVLNVAATKNAVGKNISQTSDFESAIEIPAGVSKEQLAEETDPIADQEAEVKTNRMSDTNTVSRQPEKTDKGVAGSILKKDAADLSQQGKVEQRLKVVGKESSDKTVDVDVDVNLDVDMDVDKGGKAKTSLITTAKTSTEGNQSGDTTSMGTENRHSKDRNLLSGDASRLTTVKQEPNVTQMTFSQTLEKTSPQSVSVQSEPIAQTPGLEQPFVNTDKLLSRIVGKLEVLFSEGKSEAKLKLKPEFLGDLKIHLTMDGGSMKAVLNASTSQAKELIEANLNMLKQSLENQGLQLKEFEVSVNQQQNNESHSSYRHRFFSRNLEDDNGLGQTVADEPTHADNYAGSSGNMAVNYLA